MRGKKGKADCSCPGVWETTVCMQLREGGIAGSDPPLQSPAIPAWSLVRNQRPPEAHHAYLQAQAVPLRTKRKSYSKSSFK